MEFFALAQCPLTATQIQDTLRGQQLAAWCATINRVLHWEDEQGEIYSLWGQFWEIILAISSTVEGSATGHYITTLAEGCRVKVTRLAQGVPLGGELEYVDGGTLAHAFAGRVSF